MIYLMPAYDIRSTCVSYLYFSRFHTFSETGSRVFAFTEDDDVVFTVISLDGKSWDFESTTPDVSFK